MGRSRKRGLKQCKTGGGTIDQQREDPMVGAVSDIKY